MVRFRRLDAHLKALGPALLTVQSDEKFFDIDFSTSSNSPTTNQISELFPRRASPYIDLDRCTIGSPRFLNLHTLISVEKAPVAHGRDYDKNGHNS